MKKITALILSIVTLAVIICSCGKNTKPIETETDENGEIITTATTKEQATTKNTGKETTSTTKNNTETTKKDDKNEFPEDHYIKTGYPLDNKYVETPTRVIMPAIELTYYSKLDDERYYFCFDPLCDHSKLSCVACIFRHTRGSVYSPYTNRLYMIREDTLFSMNFDGSDVKIEISLGDVGSDITKLAIGHGASGRMTNLQQYDNYLYFIFPTTIEQNDSDYGYMFIRSLFRYDLNTNKLENLFEKSNYVSNYFNSFVLSKEKIYFEDLNENGDARLFSANLDMTDMKEVDISVGDRLDSYYMIYDGEKFYSILKDYKKGEQTGALPTPESYQIVCFDPETEIITEVSEKSYSSGQNGAGMMTLYAVTDEYIYYTVADPFYIGTKHTKSGDRSVYNHSHTLYRMKKDGSEKKVVFEGVTSKDPKVISYGISELYILEDGKKAIALVETAQYSTPRIMPDGSEYANWQGSFYASFDIDDNGNFVNMHELVLDE